jgi:hypothetical protein
MNVSSIPFPLPKLLSRLAGAKVQLLFNLASFFKKNFFLFLSPLKKIKTKLKPKSHPAKKPKFLSVGEGKDTNLFPFCANVFSTFF